MSDETKAVETDEQAPTIPFRQRDGALLLQPVETLRPSQATRVAAWAERIAEAPEGERMDAIASFIEFVEDRHLRDDDAYRRFYEEKGLPEVIELIMAWLGEAVGGRA